jgi:hypothetical protein
MRSIVSYRNKVDETKGAEFKMFCPPAMKAIMDEIKIETNPLAAFIRDGDDRYQIIHKEGSFTTLTHLSMVYSKHMSYVHKKQNVSIGKDYGPITSAGYTKTQKNVCKQCGTVNPTKERCGLHYNKNNKHKKIVFDNMYIQVTAQTM